MTVEIDLSGRVAIVTGGGQGIGRAIALRLAQAGADVAVADLALDRAHTVAAELEGLGIRSLAVQADVTDPDSARRMAAEVIEAFGQVDILVNNAGRWTIKLFRDLTPAEYEAEIRPALFGVLHCSRAVLDSMTQRRQGRIINIASDAGRVGEPFLSVYSAAKAGVMGFTKALAREVGRYNITVNAVAPGTTHTPGSQEFIARAGGEEKLAHAYPLRRLGQPDDIANAVLFFASDLSSWVTGQTLSVSGGYTT